MATGTQSRVRARYAVAADGNRSPVGAGLASRCAATACCPTASRSTSGPSGTSRRCWPGRNQGVHYVTNPVLRGFFRLDRTGNGGFLVVNLVGDTARPEIVAAYPDAPWANVAEGITRDRALELLRAAIGVPGMPLVIEDIAPWQAVADVAERYARRAGVPGRRRRARGPAERRLRRQHRRARRAQPRMEARARPQRDGGPCAARDLRRGAPAGRRVHRRAVLRAVRHPGGALPGRRRRAAGG